MKGKETTKIKITKSRKLKIDWYQHGKKKEQKLEKCRNKVNQSNK